MTQLPTSRAEGAFLGLAVGDAYGRPLEFIEGIRVRNTKVFVDSNTFMWTDDTHMSLYLADAILQMSGNDFDEEDFGHLVGLQFSLWLDDPLTPSTAPGNTCLAGMQNYKTIRDWRNSGVKSSDGSGAVMRICPLALAYSGETLDKASEISAVITHGHPNAAAACVAASRMLRQTLETGQFTENMVIQTAQDIRRVYPQATDVPLALEAAVLQSRRANLDWLDEQSIPPKDGGWRSPSALGLAVTAVLRWGDDFATAVEKAARINGDSDSVACLTGMYIGASRGISAVPSNWLNALPMREDIRKKANQLLSVPTTDQSVADLLRYVVSRNVSLSMDPELQRDAYLLKADGTDLVACQSLTEVSTTLGVPVMETDGVLWVRVDRSLIPADVRRRAAHETVPEPVAFAEAEPLMFDDVIDVEPVDKVDSTSRTSLSHPILVNWIDRSIGEGQGAFGITFAPGKQASSMYGRPWSRDLNLDLDRLRSFFQVDALVSLVEEAELEQLQIADLVKHAAERKIAVYRCPIADGSIPDLQQARNIALFAVTLARAGQRVVFHCRGGLGRAGTMAAICLLHLGHPW